MLLGGMLLVICAAMVITLVPGGVGSSFGLGGPGRGVVAKVASSAGVAGTQWRNTCAKRSTRTGLAT